MNQYYKKNVFRRFWDAVVETAKSAPKKRFDAVAGAIGFFVVLVAMLEYKVFESMYGMTGDIILTASTLLVTAFGGVYAEVVLRRNEDATDDQNMFADWIFYISLGTSSIVGLGAWAQSMSIPEVDLYFIQIPLNNFSGLSVAIITIVTIVDVLILRAYFRADVSAVHRRNVAQSNSKKKEADLRVEDKLIDFEAQVKADTEQLLRVEARRVEVRAELEKMYGGRVPAEVMTNAMKKLDLIMQEIKTGEDLNKDGTIGLPPQKAVQVTPRSPQTAFAASVPDYTHEVKTNPTSGQNGNKP